MKAFCLAVLSSLALISCHHSPAPTPTTAESKVDEAARHSGKISASPNPVPPSEGMGATTITWNTGTPGWAEVYVSTNGRPEQLLGGGGTGSTTVKWIQTKRHYVFRLYDGKEHKKLLGEVEVTQQG